MLADLNHEDYLSAPQKDKRRRISLQFTHRNESVIVQGMF